jgi:hypothetical protein
MSNYNTIQFSGKLTQAGFSIYLFEIASGDKKYFYIGMTGDNFYPSARSAIHRLSGHFDLSAKSTQNQLLKAIKTNKIDIEQSQINMHHWSIEGFKPWEGSLKEKTKDSFKGNKEYEKYKEQQSKVLAFENKLIFDFKEKLLNETKGVDAEIKNKAFEVIYEEIETIIER